MIRVYEVPDVLRNERSRGPVSAFVHEHWQRRAMGP